MQTLEEIVELTKQVQETNRLAREQLARAAIIGGASTVTVKSNGLSTALAALLGASVMACVATLFGLVMLHSEIRDNKAWIDLHNNQIAKLQAKEISK
jgi:hypothetical protein